MLGATQVLIRGGTVQWSTNFYDVNGVLVQPDSATINIVYVQASDGAQTSAQVTMVAPHDSIETWIGTWDTRGVAASRPIFWSIHTGSNDPIPVSVEDGNFQLTANPANLATF